MRYNLTKETSLFFMFFISIIILVLLGAMYGRIEGEKTMCQKVGGIPGHKSNEEFYKIVCVENSSGFNLNKCCSCNNDIELVYNWNDSNYLADIKNGKTN